MFQDNPLLAQLKQQIHDSKEHVEGAKPLLKSKAIKSKLNLKN